MSDKNGLTIRTYRPDDLLACRELWIRLTEWHRNIYETREIGGSDPGRQFDALLQQAGEDGVWLAEVDGQVIGMVGLIRRGAEGELEPIVVDEAWRDRGVGHRLAEAVIAAARAGGIRVLVTRPAARNRDAIRFFHGLGFDVLGQLEVVMDLTEQATSRWRTEERVAGCQFRI